MKSLKESIWLRPELIALATISIIVHLVFRNNLEYHRDELLYFSLGMHPAAGYASVPPLIGWVAWAIQKIFGFSVMAVALFPSLLSGVMIFLAAAMAKEMGGSRYASFLGALGLLCSIYFMRTYSLFHPVHIEILLWTLAIYFVIKFINKQQDRYLIFFGITAGLALLNKYLAILLFSGLVVIIPFTDYRRIFRRRFFWAGIVSGFLIFLPNMIWQAIKGFPVFNHISELYDTQLVHMDYKLFLSEQLLMPCAGTILTLAGLIFLLAGKGMRRFRFLGFLSLFVITGLMLLKGKSYYTLGIFPLLTVSGAVAYDQWLDRKWARIAIPVLILTLTIPVIPIGLPVFRTERLIAYFKTLESRYGLDVGRRFEDGSIHSLPQDYADMIGWEEMTSLVNNAYQRITDKNASFIYGENYGQAGAVTIIGRKYGLPPAISFNESFQYWIPQEFNPDITSLVYINGEPGEDIKTLFRKITLIGRVSNRDAREYGTGVFLCEEPVVSFNSFWRSRLAED